MTITRQKALAYIIREHAGRQQVLVFDHVDAPEAGTQVPGGSIDPGESPEQGARREAFEEAGVSDLAVVRCLGAFSWHVPKEVHQRHVYHLVPTTPLPERWEHTVSAGEDDKGMRFAYFWLDIAEAATVLSGGMGQYLQYL